MLTIKFKTDNAAFSDDVGGETARVLRQIADKIESTRDGSGHVRDANGNTIGHWSLAVSDVEDDEI